MLTRSDCPDSPSGLACSVSFPFRFNLARLNSKLFCLRCPDRGVLLWQQMIMTNAENRLFLIDGKLIDDLYVEAMVLADEARGYLEKGAVIERDLLEPMDRVHFSCEALKVTTRLMQVIAWLLSRRAYMRGEIDLAESRSEKFRLGDAAPSDTAATAVFPADMRVLIAASESLYLRAQRLEEQLVDRPAPGARPGDSPARDLMQMLERAF